MNKSVHRGFYALAVFAVLGALGACASLEQLQQKAAALGSSVPGFSMGPGARSADPAEAKPGEGEKPDGEAKPDEEAKPGGESKPADAKPADAKPANQSGGGGNTWCCVNKQFNECETAERAVKCIGNPMQLISCNDKCGMSQDCTLKCIADHGPSADRGPCKRDRSRDKECR
ncbi:MAG: hypothetical protein MUF64_21275 [Polyangiaceae bacterium]|jgi:hypothetical protein|nr:hypothetical protein [Polyangiaceae bacterium]